jgi:hypothetical protein
MNAKSVKPSTNLDFCTLAAINALREVPPVLGI